MLKKIKIHIHPDYSRFEQFIKRISDGEYEMGEVYCDNRNVVFRLEYQGRAFVVKKYKLPTLINQLVYTNIRKSKARRSFEYAEKLIALDFETPKPVAYIEQKDGLMFHTAYFISEYLPYPDLSRAQELLSPEEQVILDKQFIEFTAYLHDMQVVHKDYNSTNIFFHKEGERYHFALIDINRMSFGKGNLWLWMQALNQLYLDETEVVCFVKRYAELRNLNILDCLIVLFKNRKARQRRDEAKKRFKRRFGIH